jgi:hypothetical protein
MIVAILLALTVVVALVWRVSVHPLPRPSALVVAECRAHYRDARSAADSFSIDARRPIVDPELDVPANISCGELRRTGQLGR